MELTTAEKIRIIMRRRGMTVVQLAEATQQSRQNLDQKLKRDNFSERELKKICEALNCTYQVALVLNDTGESI